MIRIYVYNNIAIATYFIRTINNNPFYSFDIKVMTVHMVKNSKKEKWMVVAMMK